MILTDLPREAPGGRGQPVRLYDEASPSSSTSTGITQHLGPRTDQPVRCSPGDHARRPACRV